MKGNKVKSSKFLHALSPKNKAQKKGIFAAVVLFLLMLILHNPWDGYIITYDYQKFNEILQPDGSIIVNGMIYGGTKMLSPLYWHSTNPIIIWFGSLLHVVISIFALTATTIAWLFLVKDES